MQKIYDEAARIYDDPGIADQSDADFHCDNIPAGQNIITFTYSDQFGKNEGPTGICRLFGPRSIFNPTEWRPASAVPDLFKLCELRSAGQKIVGCEQHAELIDAIIRRFVRAMLGSDH